MPGQNRLNKLARITCKNRLTDWRRRKGGERTMDDGFQQRVAEILADALDLQSAEERAAYLSEACEGNPELRRQVDSLLQARERAGEFPGKRPVPF